MIKKALVILLVLTSPLLSKVYDCFCFYDEFEILKIRLEELWDVVDYFVLVESIETQKGRSKPLCYRDNAHLFEKYASKIIPVAIEERHPEFIGLWDRENYQRNCIARALVHCQPEDIIIISDVDEIPRKSHFPKILDYLRSQSFHHLKDFYRGVVATSLQQTIYFYQLNRQTPTKEWWGGGHWVGSVFTTYADLQRVEPQYFRDHRGHFFVFKDAGWHFTWMGGREKIRQKLRSVVEGLDETSEASDETVDGWINNHPLVPIDDTFPEYIRDNLDYFIKIGFVGS